MSAEGCMGSNNSEDLNESSPQDNPWGTNTNTTTTTIHEATTSEDRSGLSSPQRQMGDNFTAGRKDKHGDRPLVEPVGNELGKAERELKASIAKLEQLVDTTTTFDWSSYFGPVLLTKSNMEVSTNDALKGKSVAIYFSASYCSPCKSFSPLLAKYYNIAKRGGSNFEVVFASSDGSFAEFKSYFGEMPWLALPYANKSAKERLSKMFGVGGIPCLIILHPDGTIDTDDGRSRVVQDMGPPAPGGFSIHQLIVFYIIYKLILYVVEVYKGQSSKGVEPSL